MFAIILVMYTLRLNAIFLSFYSCITCNIGMMVLEVFIVSLLNIATQKERGRERERKRERERERDSGETYLLDLSFGEDEVCLSSPKSKSLRGTFYLNHIIIIVKTTVAGPKNV